MSNPKQLLTDAASCPWTCTGLNHAADYPEHLAPEQGQYRLYLYCSQVVEDVQFFCAGTALVVMVHVLCLHRSAASAACDLSTCQVRIHLGRTKQYL